MFLRMSSFGLLVMCSVFAAAQSPQLENLTELGSLRVGDDAPAVEVHEWIVRAERQAENPKVRVLVLWSTWAPGAQSLPEVLNPWLEEFPEEVRISAISIAESRQSETDETHVPRLRQFVENWEEAPLFSVGVDRLDSFMMLEWLLASGRQEIPTVFLMNQDGKIAFAGSLGSEFERVLRGMVDGSVDPFEEARAQEARQERLAEFQLALGQVQANDDARVLELIDGLIADLPDTERQLWQVRLGLISQLRPADLMAEAQIYEERYAQDSFGKLSLSGVLTGPEDLPEEVYAYALALATAGYEGLETEEFPATALYAMALFRVGEIEKAIEKQERAIVLCRQQAPTAQRAELISQLESRLALFRLALSEF